MQNASVAGSGIRSLCMQVTNWFRGLTAPTERKGLQSILMVDRNSGFDTLGFFGVSYTVIEDTEFTSLASDLIPINGIVLDPVSFYMDQGRGISGLERLKRLRDTGAIRLDAKVFQMFWQNKHLIPSAWKYDENGETIFICFDGTQFIGLTGSLFVVYLYWDTSRMEWRRDTEVLGPSPVKHRVSATLNREWLH